MLCRAVTSRGTPCQRDGHLVASVPLCWQHAQDFEHHYRATLGIYERDDRIAQLDDRISQLERHIQGLQEALSEQWFDRVQGIQEANEKGATCEGPCVYIAESPLVPGLVKIGYTTKLAARMSSLAARALVAIPGTREDEAVMHSRFWHLRWHNEWFMRKAELAAFIEEQAA